MAIFSKNKSNIVPEAIQALKTLRHRGKDAYGIATHNQIVIAKTLKELETKQFKSSIVLGHVFSRIHQTDKPKLGLTEKFAFVYEGRLFFTTAKSETEEFKAYLGANYQENALKATTNLDGAFSFAITNEKEIMAGRDPLGTVPLYYGENSNIYALATERKALWELHISNVQSFPPGNVATINEKGFSFKTAKTLTQKPTISISIEDAAKQLQSLLLQSCQKRVSDIDKVAVAFSGGLDSSLIALCTKLCNVEVHLFTVGLKDEKEVEHAKKAASALGLPIHVETYTLTDIEKIVKRVLWLIEKAEATQLAIAVPLYWTAQLASHRGFHVLLTGQGSDELFGGYHKYLTEYAKFGLKGLQNAMWKDTVFSYEKNFERDNKICAFHNVELRLPFADFKLADFALSLPPKMKIASKQDNLRKRILRTVALKLGMPPFIANRRKKAIQYATGVNDALKKIARKEGLTLKEYVEKRFQELYT
jgi:asparagine synthase (glutamine-hydrolysing)